MRVILSRHSLTASYFSEKFELVRFDFLVTLAIITVEPDVDFIAGIVHIPRKLDLACAL